MVKEWYNPQISHPLTEQEKKALSDIKVFGLSGTKALAKQIANQLGLELGSKRLSIFADHEMSPDFTETIRGYRLYIVGSTHDYKSILELLFTVDAARRAGAAQVNVVVPYYGYARQDRKGSKRGGIGSRVIADCMEVVGIDSIMVVDLHASQTEASFKKEVIHLEGQAIFLPVLKAKNQPNMVICSPDAGGVARAKRFSDRLDIPLVMINKHRDKPNSIESMDLVGDVRGKHVVIVDDMVDTGGSLVKASNLLLDNGALSVCACITHGVLSEEAYTKIGNSRLEKLYVANTTPVPAEKIYWKKHFDEDGEFINETNEGVMLRPANIEVVDCSPFLSNVIKAIGMKDSVSSLQK